MDKHYWLKQHLQQNTNYKITQQARWVETTFDFWLHEPGIAIQLHNNNPHDDERHFKRSGIITIRIQPYNQHQANQAINTINKYGTWNDRRKHLQITNKHGINNPNPNLLHTYLNNPYQDLNHPTDPNQPTLF